jgi:hypothetical protein
VASPLSKDELAPIIERFAARHLKPEWRKRLSHEALKKPGRLQWRIHHQLPELIDEHFRGAPHRLPQGHVLQLATTGFLNIGRITADNEVWSLPGLLIAEEGNWFRAMNEPAKGARSEEFSSTD